MFEDIVSWWIDQASGEVFSGGLALAVAGAAAAAVHRLLPSAWHMLASALVASVTVDGRSPVFQPLLTWLHHHPYSRRCRRLAVNRRNDDDDGEITFSPAPGHHVLFHRGLPVWLHRERKEARDGHQTEAIRLTAAGFDQSLLRGLLGEAIARFGGRDPGTTAIFTAGEYNEWEQVAKIPRRALASVVLPDATGEALFADAQAFLAGAAWYAERGIPWRRGYLLSGPPGTGKTSLIKALAGALDLDIALVGLSASRMDDRGLCTLLAAAPRRSVLVIEDIDAAFRVRKKDEASAQVTFSGVLNAIDGVMSQEGHLLFMTTNHPDLLDPALIRPGRADVHVELSHADAAMAKRMFMAFYPGHELLAERFARAFGRRRAAPAALQAYFLLHRDDPETAARLPNGRATQDLFGGGVLDRGCGAG